MAKTIHDIYISEGITPQYLIKEKKDLYDNLRPVEGEDVVDLRKAKLRNTMINEMLSQLETPAKSKSYGTPAQEPSPMNDFDDDQENPLDEEGVMAVLKKIEKALNDEDVNEKDLASLNNIPKQIRLGDNSNGNGN